MSGANDVRAMWSRIRDEADAAAQASKNSHGAVLELSQRYKSLDPQQREIVDEILTEWVLSDDETKRFDALALIDEYRVRSALAALRTLAARLEGGTGPGAPYEWAKVNRIIAALADGGEDP